MNKIKKMTYVILLCTGVTFWAPPCYSFGFPTFDIAEVAGTIKGVVTSAQSLKSSVDSALSQAKEFVALGNNLDVITKFRDAKALAERAKEKVERVKKTKERIAKLRKKIAGAKDLVSGAINDVKDVAGQVTSTITDAKDMVNDAKNKVETAVSDAKGAVDKAKGAVDSAKDAVDSAVSGAKGAVDAAKGKVDSAVSAAQGVVGNVTGQGGNTQAPAENTPATVNTNGVAPLNIQTQTRGFKTSSMDTDGAEFGFGVVSSSSYAQLSSGATGTNEEGKFLFSEIIAVKCDMGVDDAENEDKVRECIQTWVECMAGLDNDGNKDAIKGLECKEEYKKAMHEHVAANLASSIAEKEYANSFSADVAEDIESKGQSNSSERDDIAYVGEIGKANQELLLKLMDSMSRRLMQESFSAVNHIDVSYYEDEGV